MYYLIILIIYFLMYFVIIKLKLSQHKMCSISHLKGLLGDNVELYIISHICDLIWKNES